MKKIVINEYQLNKMLLDMGRNYTSGKYFINEMPYTPKDFLILADTSARKAYIHLAKIFLFGDSTRNAKDWLSQVINNFTIPMITSSVSKSVKLTKKGVKKAYLTNFFDLYGWISLMSQLIIINRALYVNKQQEGKICAIT